MQLKIIYKNIKKNNIFIHKMEQNNETNTLLFQILEEMKSQSQINLDQKKAPRESFDFYHLIYAKYKKEHLKK